jgi:hypothetical protein
MFVSLHAAAATRTFGIAVVMNLRSRFVFVVSSKLNHKVLLIIAAISMVHGSAENHFVASKKCGKFG